MIQFPTRVRQRLQVARRSLAILFLAFVVTLGVGTEVRSQTSSDAPASSTSSEKSEASSTTKKEVIRVADLGSRSEKSKITLMKATALTKPDGTVEKTVVALPALRAEIKEKLHHSELTRSESPSLPALDRLAKAWERVNDKVVDSQSLLDDRMNEIEKAIAQILKERNLWSNTRISLLQQGVSGEALNQISEVDAIIADALDAANAQQAAVIRLQSDVASLGLVIQSDLDQITQSRNAVVAEVFNPDSEAMWKPEFWNELAPEDVRAIVGAYVEDEVQSWSGFFEANRDRVIIYVVLTGVLVIGILVLRKRIDTNILDSDEFSAVRAMLRRPISLGLLLSFSGALFIFAGSLRNLEYVLGGITVIPAVLILRRIFDPSIYPILTMTIVIYLLANLQSSFASLPDIARLIAAVEMISLISFCWFWIRPSRLAKIPAEDFRNRAFRIVGLGLKVIFAISVVSLSANVAGYSFLAQLTSTAVGMSIYGAVIFYSAVVVLDGVVAYLMHVRPLNRVRIIRNNAPLIRKRLYLFFEIVAWWYFLRGILIRLEIWDDIQELWSVLMETSVPLPEIEITVGNVLASILVFCGALLLSRFIQFVLKEDIYPRVGVHPGRAISISTLTRYAMLIVGFVLATAALGFDANRFTLLAGAFGVGIGFGLQTIVNNFISGIILLTEQPVQVGDAIAIGEIMGEIQRIGIRSSTVRTWQGAEVIIPNADLISEQVTNWTRSDRRRRVEIKVGVAYGTDPHRVLEILLRVAGEGEGLLEEPRPYILFIGFGESSLDFEVRAWTDEFDRFTRVQSALGIRILAALQEAGIEIPFPQRDLHLRSSDIPVDDKEA
ncbi:MAG: mechanosensitive ion channel domain-containing protein [Myxococcota bacterium]|nr:mechanosensitive ion channel domain-containing protein [Myxococcota bacterium]